MQLETEIGIINIRDVIESDAESAVEFMNWVTGEVDFHTYGVNDFLIKQEDRVRMIQLFKEKHNCKFLVATFNEQIIAVATLSGGIKERIRHRGTIGITVAKRYWRLGIGQKMMEMIIDYSRKSDVLTKLELLVHESNYPAIELYVKLGFFQEGVISRYFLFEEDYYSGIRMGKYVDEINELV